MTVYVDPAAHPFRGMLMCHLWADSIDELYAMVDAIGVQRKWLQQPPAASWVHFDISKGKRDLAVKLGAVETDKYGPSEHVCRQRLVSGNPSTVEYANRMLGRIEMIRDRGKPPVIQGDLFG